MELPALELHAPSDGDASPSLASEPAGTSPGQAAPRGRRPRARFAQVEETYLPELKVQKDPRLS